MTSYRRHKQSVEEKLSEIRRKQIQDVKVNAIYNLFIQRAKFLIGIALCWIMSLFLLRLLRMNLIGWRRWRKLLLGNNNNWFQRNKKLKISDNCFIFLLHFITFNNGLDFWRKYFLISTSFLGSCEVVSWGHES